MTLLLVMDQMVLWQMLGAYLPGVPGFLVYRARCIMCGPSYLRNDYLTLRMIRAQQEVDEMQVDHSSAPSMTDVDWDDAWASSSVGSFLDNLDDYEYSENTLSVIRGYVGSDNSPTSD